MAGERLEATRVKRSDHTEEEWKEISRKGGINSGIAKRKKKTVQELAKIMLEQQLPNKQKKGLKKQFDELDETDLNGFAAIIAGQIQSAVSGNTKAFEKLLELTEQQLAEKDLKYKIPAADISKAFVDLNRDIDNRRHTEYWLRGGRASLKSSYVSLKIVELLVNNPNMCAIIIRRVGNTIKDSVFSQMQWALEQAGLASEVKCITSPYEMTIKKTGQKIYFRGLDDAAKIKSIKPPNGMYLGIRWYEEADQIQGMETMRKTDQSVVRGGDDFIEFVTYNTPKSALHWINVEASTYKADRLTHLSTYLDSPPEWIGSQFISDAEWLKNTNETAYKNEYLGEATGSGTEVFNNLTSREITDEEIANYDYLYNGLDWGWYPDPLQFVKCAYNAKIHTLCIYDEWRTWETPNRDVAEYLLDNKISSDDIVTCDSAEKKSVADLKSCGVNARAAEKGPGSVKYGIKWLQSLCEIVIDSKRCPNVWKEFSQYQYELTKDGEPISEYPDKDNHSIDAVRYAMERVWKRKGQ